MVSVEVEIAEIEPADRAGAPAGSPQQHDHDVILRGRARVFEVVQKSHLDLLFTRSNTPPEREQYQELTQESQAEKTE
jgi:hypothetical protein